MNSSLSKNQDYRLVAFHPSFENVHALLIELHLYVFSEDGRLIESQAIRREKVTVAIAAEELRNAKIVIAPPLDGLAGDASALGVARSQAIFETNLRYDSAQSYYELPAVPETVWRWWLVHSLWQNVRKFSRRKNGLLSK